MNEHIRELAVDASVNSIIHDSELNIHEEYIDKLVEIIIKECDNSKLQDSDLHSQNLLYEFNIDNRRNQK